MHKHLNVTQKAEIITLSDITFYVTNNNIYGNLKTTE